MSRRRRVGLLLAAVVSVALAFRAAPLYWSPYPSTLDGFNYAALARTVVDTGAFPFTDRADSLLFTTLFATAGLVFDADPLHVAQPLATVVGTLVVLVGAVLARRIVRDSARLSVSPSSVAVVTAGLLAVEGLFLRRTLVPDEEIVGILLTFTVAFALHYAYRTGEARWYGLVALVLGVFPLLHTFTSFVVGLVVTALTARHVSKTLSVRSLVGGVAVAGGFWAYVALYYGAVATRLSLTVPYVDRVTAYPGLFVAWVIVLAIGVVWFQRTDLRIRQGVYLAVVGTFFAVVLLNAFAPIFPGTVSTPRLVLALVGLLAFVAVAAAPSLDVLDEYRGATLLVALFAAPAVIIGFSLTASLTPEYFATAMRAQTFLHFPVLAVAAVTLVRVLDSGRPSADGLKRALSVALAVLVVLTVVASAPLAYLNMDTASAPSTTLDSEYRGVAFLGAHTDRAWTGGHTLTRVGIYIFGSDASVGPAASWLTGGPSPTCPVVSQRSWTTTGAHLFPSSPQTVAQSTYEGWLDSRNVVYTANGLDPVVVSTPADAVGEGC
ncbi:hypothetical protein [Halogeometricum luteum]|uniref:Sodium/phosphate symporter n=1 Tax=Halogeometricum luteum TaxID=2950537 RepID=A0ABU2G3Z8_9EURY|nr:hypothetical protein [Halogeometricum sp. S3BR5-2]MDS0295003.1 hypothetical protein [Halogeometricum sp. S3BR5-2]